MSFLKLPVVTKALLAICASYTPAKACPNVSDNEYLNSRFVFCRSYLSDELEQLYLARRFDGSRRIVQISEAERLIASLNSLSRGEASDIDAVIAQNPSLAVSIRGLLAAEVFSEPSRKKYCAYKFDRGEAEGLTMPHPSDPGIVRDIDYFFGCRE